MLFQLVGDQCQGQLCGIDRHIYIPEYIRQCPDMILMPMGDHKSFNLGNIILQISHIRDHQIDTQHIILRESKTAVHYYNAVIIFKSCNIHTDLLKSSQRDDL